MSWIESSCKKCILFLFRLSLSIVVICWLSVSVMNIKKRNQEGGSAFSWHCHTVDRQCVSSNPNPVIRMNTLVRVLLALCLFSPLADLLYFSRSFSCRLGLGKYCFSSWNMPSHNNLACRSFPLHPHITNVITQCVRVRKLKDTLFLNEPCELI